jgi:hypothetical protein
LDVFEKQVEAPSFKPVTALEKQAKTLLMFLFCILSLPFFLRTVCAGIVFVRKRLMIFFFQMVPWCL